MADANHLRPPAWSALPRALYPVVVSLAIALVLYFIIAPRIGGFASDLLMNSGIAIILATSLTVVNGFTGQFSIGHAGFMSLGGYAAATLIYYGSFHFYRDFDFHGGLISWSGAGAFTGPLIAKGDILFIAACLFGALVAALAGWIVGLPSLRLRGDYLAIVTLGFGEIVRVLIQGTPDQLDTTTDPAITDVPFLKQLPHLGGALGFSGAPAYSTVFWIWLAVGITLAAIIRLKQSSYGRALLSVREDEVAAQAMGVNITKYKVRAFVFSAFFAGLAGALYAMKVGTINAGELAFQKSFDIVIMVVLGGLGSVSGAAVAAVILTLLPELLRDPPDLYPWGLIAAAIVAVMILAFAPRKRGPLLTLAGVCIGWELMRWTAHLLHIDLSDYRMIIYALALIIMMIVRPQGLFGIREIWDYLPQSWQFWRNDSAIIIPPRSTRMIDAPSPTDGLLHVEDVSISFGGLKAVQKFSLSLPKGALYGLIGPNGAGKTTAFNLLTGVYRPDTGSVRVAGKRVDGKKPYQIAHAGLARTFQNIRLFGELSVLDNVRLGCQMRKAHGLWTTILRTSGDVTAERTIDVQSKELLNIFGLETRSREQAKNLPYGDQRRLEIARALATSPKVLLLDEPAAGMNPQEKLELMNLIRFIRQKFSIAILLIEHDMKLVMNVCENITVLDHGETLATGTPAEIRSNPKVIEAYLGDSD